jgi:DMSO/TMAO reductase YedYZ molybdopterin-dependent catalytic subunit
MTDARDSAAPRPDPEPALGEEQSAGQRASRDKDLSGRDPISAAEFDRPASAPGEGDAVVAEDSSPSQSDAVDTDPDTVAARSERAPAEVDSPASDADSHSITAGADEVSVENPAAEQPDAGDSDPASAAGDTGAPEDDAARHRDDAKPAVPPLTDDSDTVADPLRAAPSAGRSPARHPLKVREGPKTLGSAISLLRDYQWPQLPFRSPIRGPWLTSVFGAVLLASLPIVIITGLLSWIAYGPRFGQSIPGDVGWLHLPVFDWPTRPSSLYRLTQGVHVGLGLILIPWVLAKLWSVIPKFFHLPPVRSPAEAVERISLLALVGGILFEIATGVLNIQYDYIFGFSFYTAHYWGAWVFISGFVVHVTVKLPTMVHSLRSRSFRSVLRTNRAHTVAEARDETGLVAAHPGPATISRRGAIGLVAGGSLFVTILTIGETTGGVLRRTAILLPRGRSYGNGPTDFQINRTAVAAGVTPDQYSDGWRLKLTGGANILSLSRPQLLAMDQHTVDLPIACVEGWSTVQTWAGVRLRDLAAAVAVQNMVSARVESFERFGAFKSVQFTADQMLHPDSLLALRVNGVDLTLDHGFPARIMMPAIPGVHTTKWVETIEFREG